MAVLKTVGKINALTAITKIKNGHAPQLRQSLEGLTGAGDGKIASLGAIYIVRWDIFDNDTRPLFATDFNGDVKAYMRDLAEPAPESIDAIRGHYECYSGARLHPGECHRNRGLLPRFPGRHCPGHPQGAGREAQSRRLPRPARLTGGVQRSGRAGGRARPRRHPRHGASRLSAGVRRSVPGTCTSSPQLPPLRRRCAGRPLKNSPRASRPEASTSSTRSTPLQPGPDGRPTAVEHFGYRDGIGQPSIEGSGMEAVPGQGAAGVGGVWRAPKPGEFVLGHPDETGGTPTLPQPDALGRNGTYLVLRNLNQHVWRFRRFLQQNTTAEDQQKRQAAKMMGRWRSGAARALSPDADDPAVAADPARNNDFTYADGPKCVAFPLRVRIRRMNPRNGLPGPERETVNRHCVLPRGLAYRTRLPPGATEGDGAEHGAVIILITTEIGRQFELVQSVWTNGGGFARLDDNEKDPPIGASGPDGGGATGVFTIPRSVPPRRRLQGIPAFVSTRGGEYFFLPVIHALHHLSSNHLAAAAAPAPRHPALEAAL